MDTAAALAALAALEVEAERAGERTADGFWRGADGRLRDAKGRFASEDVFRPIVDQADKAGSAIGSAMNAALGAVGEMGPAKVGILAAAIQALPAVAGVAASGIVLAIGAGLLTAGIMAVSQSEKVQATWSQAADVIKADMADAAQPLEASTVRAADVAISTFERIKPALSRIFRDLVPDVDAFVDGVGVGVQRIMPHLEKVGDSFGDLLANLGREMPAIMDALGGAFSTFAEIMDENPAMLANLIKDAVGLLQVGADVLSWADEIKVAFDTLTATNPTTLVDRLMGGSPEEQMRALEELPNSMAAMELSVRKAIAAQYDLGKAGGDAASSVRDLNEALKEHYDPAAKALEAEIGLKRALEESAEAGKIAKMSETDRLAKVQELTGAIAKRSMAEMDSTGKTKESTAAFLSALPQLTAYAGSNDTAKAAIAALGESLGITTQKTKGGILAVNELGEVIKILPNGKKVEIDASTAAGKKQIADFLLYVARQKGTIDVHVRTIYDNPSGRAAIAQKTRASGGIYSGDGNTRYMAAGGITSGSSSGPPPPMIADKATFLPHNNTIFGEAGREAFIPMSGKHRSRALGILAEVADALGVEVFNKQASKRMQDSSDVINQGAGIVSTGLESAMGVVSGSLGASGTLTSAIIGVGETGGQVADSWITGSDQITRSVEDAGDRIGDITHGVAGTVSAVVDDMTGRMGASIGDLTSSVGQLAQAIVAAKAAAAKAPAQKAGKGGDPADRGSSAGSVIPPGPGSHPADRGSSAGSVIPPGPKSKSPGGLVGGHYGTAASVPLVDMSGSSWTVREEADIDKIGNTIGFKVLAQGLT
ncbi:hypothetical protein AB0K05_24945 [Nonomuraea sp. NPDC049486]|uniref:hypothetical protein n=1 Tax=Nonomuraea sp. NPDC049486 TaxID=3155773 RepID=UPI00342EA05D